MRDERGMRIRLSPATLKTGSFQMIVLRGICVFLPHGAGGGGGKWEIAAIFSPAPPSVFRPFDSVITSDSLPPLHQPYFLLTSPPLISRSLQAASECAHTYTHASARTRTYAHTHTYLYLLSAYVPDCNPGPLRDGSKQEQ